ncbi:MAG: hypothetical protein ACFE0P_16005 [Oceanicaulis sp.]
MIRALVISSLAIVALAACNTRPVNVTLEPSESNFARLAEAQYVQVALVSGETFRATYSVDIGASICAEEFCVRKHEVAAFSFNERRWDAGSALRTVVAAPIALPAAVFVATAMASAGSSAPEARGGVSERSTADRSSVLMRNLSRRQRPGPISFFAGGMTYDGRPCANGQLGSGEAPRTDLEAGLWLLQHRSALSSQCFKATEVLWSDLVDQSQRAALNLFYAARSNWEAMQCHRVLVGPMWPRDQRANAASISNWNVIFHIRMSGNEPQAYDFYTDLLERAEIAYDAPTEANCARLNTVAAAPELLEQRMLLFDEISDLHYRGPAMILDGDQIVRGHLSYLENADARRAEVEGLLAQLPALEDPTTNWPSNSMDNPA